MSIPETKSASRITADCATSWRNSSPVSLWIRNTCSTLYSRLLNKSISPNDFPLRQLSIRHVNGPNGETLFECLVQPIHHAV